MSEDINVRLTRKMLWVIIAALGLAVIALVLFLIGAPGKWVGSYNKTEVVLQVVDNESKKPVEGAQVKLNGATAISSESGLVALTNLHKGAVKLVVSKTGYQDYSMTTTLKRGKNDLGQLPLTLTPTPKVAVGGKIINWVTGQAVSDAQVGLAEETVQSGADGAFGFQRIPVGSYVLNISKTGYIAAKRDVKIEKDTTSLGDVELVPAGKIVFVSNRDGKRGIYTSNYDGTEQVQFVPREGEAENYGPVLSPHANKVAFFSTKDNKKNSYGTIVGLPYLVDVSGSNLNKLADLYSVYGMSWSGSGGYIGFTGKEQETDASSKMYLYDLVSKKLSTASDVVGSVQSFSFSSDDKYLGIITYETGVQAQERYKLYLGKADGRDMQKVVGGADSIYDFKFSQDNQALEYTQYPSGGGKKRYSYNIGSGEISEISKDVTVEGRLSRGRLSPDKTKTAYIENRDGKANVFVSDANGKNEVKVTDLGTVVESSSVEWSQEGQYIFFNNSKTGEYARYIVPATGGTAKKVVDVYQGGYEY